MILFDKLNITSDRTYTSEGFLKVPARISRVGIQDYLAVEMGLDGDPTRIIKVYRPESEVFSPESLQSFSNKTITDNHPPDLITSLNAKQFAVGFSGDVVDRDDIYVKAYLTVTDENVIRNIKNGKVELSNGYTSDIEWTPGVAPSGEQYDAIQTNIRGNHIAIVEKGRAGSECKISDKSPTEKEGYMKITIDGIDFDITDQAAQAVSKLQRRLTDMEEEMEKKDKEMEEMDEEMEKEKAEAKKNEDSLKAKLDDSASKILDTKALDKAIAERMKLVDSIRRVSPDIKWEGKDDKTLLREVVSTNCTVDDSVSDDYIKARFDIMLESLDSNSQQNLDNAFAKSVTQDKTVSDTRPLHVIAREKMMLDSQNAWKNKGDK